VPFSTAREAFGPLETVLARVRNGEFTGVFVIAWRSNGGITEFPATSKTYLEVAGAFEIVKQAGIARYLAALQQRDRLQPDEKGIH
jgi:hypothetical protein